MSCRIGIYGATGYTGEELLLLAERHEGVRVVFATSERETGTRLGALYPRLVQSADIELVTAAQAQHLEADLIFLCLPAGESARIAQTCFRRQGKIIDLGADFRFASPETYRLWYHQPHTASELLAHAVYGLPEWYRDKIRSAEIVGNPGCYPTAILLALLPFLQSGWVDCSRPIIADAKSGISGAGKSPSKSTHFFQAHESVSAYKPGRQHRHVGEIESQAAEQAGDDVQVLFTPHLIPMGRGLYATVYFRLNRQASTADLLDRLQTIYADEPFIRVTETELPATRSAQHGNTCILSAFQEPATGMAVLFSAI
ncbi:N-acetyl-gamma-glutamyl-phosphate reductase, partial [candidate division KSB1 bacterium]|nr:N-acetyl-gamma-glutamyl-phosphate reductase [candidate division KSB1 bacterium]